MRYIDEFRDSAAASLLIKEIQHASRPVTIIEFCGGHTHAIMRYGLRAALAPAIRLLSGPGCPVCVTADSDIDAAHWLAAQPGIVLATFGDMLRVPGSRGSLEEARARGARIEMVYSALDALSLARELPEMTIVLLGVGFETTAPTVAAAILQAERESLGNFCVFSLHKLTPPAMRSILSSQVHLDAVLGPGHVSAIIGWQAWEFIPREFGVSCAAAGFEPVDILLAIRSLVNAVLQGQPSNLNSYQRGARPEGNLIAQRIMAQVFDVSTAEWRGLGCLPESGLVIRDRFSRFDARQRFQVPHMPSSSVTSGCRCGAVLAAIAEPADCPLFGNLCTPVRPLGPCMVSSEGACAAYFRYGSEL